MKAKLKYLIAIILMAALGSENVVFAATASASIPVLETYQDLLPEGLTKNVQYTKYLLPRHYVWMKGEYGNIRTKPSTSGSYIRRLFRNQRVGVMELVKGQKVNGSDQWYKAFWYDSGKLKTGYIHSGLVEKRQYDYDRALAYAKQYKEAIDAGRIGRITNFRNAVGVAPKFEGKEEADSFGILRYQAAAGYESPDLKSAFRYIQDGKIVNIIGEAGDFYEVEVIDLEKTVFILKKFVTETSSVSTLSQIIFVDRKQQNEMTLEYGDSGWELVSYAQVTTGANDEYRVPTDLGLFMAIAKKPKFEYLTDTTKILDGYAPYAIRFNGGAFLHGVPVDYILEKKEEVIKPAQYDSKGKLIREAVIKTTILSKEDPGMIEMSSTLGTIPRSHKCVRNYTSHAKFLYDRIKIGEAAVVVFE